MHLHQIMTCYLPYEISNITNEHLWTNIEDTPNKLKYFTTINICFVINQVCEFLSFTIQFTTPICENEIN